MKQIVKLKMSKVCVSFLLRGLRLDPKGISVSWHSQSIMRRAKGYRDAPLA